MLKHKMFFSGIKTFLFGISFILLSCCHGRLVSSTGVETDSINYVVLTDEILGERKGEEIIIAKDVDLNNAKCYISKRTSLVFNGGIIKNGIIVGNNTKIKPNHGVCFENVKIQGVWNVPEISTDMFKDLSYNNSLKDLLALTNPAIYNSVHIKNGEYLVSVQSNWSNCLIIQSNTCLLLEGSIILEPNSFRGYNVVNVQGNNIKICGNGAIIGDKNNHIGNDGEWGMGVNLDGARNVEIKGLTIKDCWGDCIYIGGKTQKVLIDNCLLHNGRRQGISITDAKNIIIRNCIITNICGTNPEYAIDFEPNKGGTVDNLIVENCIIKQCKGGILSSVGSNSEGKKIGSLYIRGCCIKTSEKEPIRLRKCKYILVEDCSIYVPDSIPAIYLLSIKRGDVRNNTITTNNKIKLIEKGVFIRKKRTGKINIINNCIMSESKLN